MNSQQDNQEETLRKSLCKTPIPITYKVYELIDLSKNKADFWRMIKENGWLEQPPREDNTQYMRYGFIHFWYRREILNEYIPTSNESDPFLDEPKKTNTRQISLL